MRELVFIHGRSQQHRDASALKQAWIDAWAAGLRQHGLTVPIPASAIHFPYYGDTLDQLVQGASGDEAAAVVVRGSNLDENGKRFVQELLREIAGGAGLTDAQVAAAAPADVREKGPLNWGWVRALATAIDRYVPGGSGSSVALFTNDVYQYLSAPGIRDAIDTGVRGAFRPGVPTVVVGHSLGTIVAYNVLRRDGDSWDVPQLVTVGSPLAVSIIKKQLTPIRYPRCVKAWFNAMDPRDIVALYPLDNDHFHLNPEIKNKTSVANETPNRHGIEGYLSDADVACCIYDALTVGSPAG
ncbi:MAG TPA: hypothetical protein VFI79_18395 [Gemmatimonadales bacterium]|nr:hypothetical protein [Gemmatimonadales bacterium]